MTQTILLAAGGTGGHLFPATALAQELTRRGFAVELATDERAGQYGTDFPARATYEVPSATFSGRSPGAVMKTLSTLGKGYFRARRLLEMVQPHVVVGFGGYPTLPPLLAARSLAIPTVLHEQNAVMGRANRLLSRFADAIALSFGTTKHLRRSAEKRSVVTGNPVRDAVVGFRDQDYAPPEAAGRLLLLIFGGSQGARFFSEMMPEALAKLPSPLRWRLTVVQQARPEDVAEVRDAYREAEITAHVAPFFKDLPERIANSHLVISRAGASTVAEVTAIGRPAILVPLPHAIDNDQLENARRLEESGGGWCMHQSSISPEFLAGRLEELLANPDRLAQAAAKSKAMGNVYAVNRLADLVADLAGPDGA
ncbi:UDP-N-acetylglucosamine--N-acetylmuramyl-(pentapeptide) pyrophosphoryl-undecaprenol N-acetylglucosamine transferase [Methyloceanibacter stevinii]|uniref:UDP-N-acetylglucosamine--N-acetylmuramyl-(pentapeptide) pyrophosphoryl-undecaprenol N-acetylglucosamine transferase n=1 Tax=Methyloceanibacter stevinii TaxID=1774970 RepID=A0A1E3VKL0_9HYPH|nr:undecaprenyldiphospho-muramoylpentapeptide beta-N-acetylglucosaminyltransferase [Methyloceanibacter stevinii]ODR93821.1 UDP-N-acetylglucosamine--N-acetylmuramyl-(pentapeptide) pyrophosphoryl-undecaprenol N-acetylglucosamine transferase [Methyloceanibacter stevinii]